MKLIYNFDFENRIRAQPKIKSRIFMLQLSPSKKPKAAPNNFECPAYEDLRGMNPTEVLEYRIHQGQIQAISRPVKMIMSTIDRIVAQYNISSQIFDFCVFFS